MVGERRRPDFRELEISGTGGEPGGAEPEGRDRNWDRGGDRGRGSGSLPMEFMERTDLEPRDGAATAVL